MVSLALVATGIVTASIERRMHLLSRFINAIVYDNKSHYLTCEQLPDAKEVGRVVKEHKDVVERIIKEVDKRIRGSDVTPVWEVTDTGDGGRVYDDDNTTHGYYVEFSWGEPYEASLECLNTGKGDIEISYPSHKDRVIIEKIIGADTFFGIPYRLRNI